PGTVQRSRLGAAFSFAPHARCATLAVTEDGGSLTVGGCGSSCTATFITKDGRVAGFSCGADRPARTVAERLHVLRVRCPCCQEQHSDTGNEPAGHINPQRLLLLPAIVCCWSRATSALLCYTPFVRGWDR